MDNEKDVLDSFLKALRRHFFARPYKLHWQDMESVWLDELVL